MGQTGLVEFDGSPLTTGHNAPVEALHASRTILHGMHSNQIHCVVHQAYHTAADMLHQPPSLQRETERN